MSYKLKKLTVENANDFFMNPFSASASIDDLIIQKYSVTKFIDTIFILNNENSHFKRAGLVNYDVGKIFVLDSAFELIKLLKKDSFILDYDFRNNLNNKITDAVLKLKEEKEEEIKSSDTYIEEKFRLTNIYRDGLIFSKLGTKPCFVSNDKDWEQSIFRFIRSKSLENLLEMGFCSIEKIEAYATEIVQSKEFLSYEFIIPELLREVDEYVEAGVFTKREKCLINYLEKTSTSSKKLKIEDCYGNIKIIENEVHSTGSVYGSSHDCYCIDFEEIKTVRCNNKVIYKK